MRWAALALCLLTGCASVGGSGKELSLSARGPNFQQRGNVDPETRRIQEEIQKYHDWLESTGRLLQRMWPPYNPDGRYDPKELMEDPDNPGEYIRKPPDPDPTPEEIQEAFERLMKDPSFRKALEENQGPQV